MNERTATQGTINTQDFSSGIALSTTYIKNSDDEILNQLPKWIQLLKKLETEREDTS